MNPNDTPKLKRAMIDYLDEAFPIKKAMPSIEERFAEFQQHGLDFVQDPYVEVSTEYTSAEKNLGEMVHDGELHQEVAYAFAKYLLEDEFLPDDQWQEIHLYQHQYESFRQVMSGKNLVVCTGTGSGKTECFLLPIVEQLYRAHCSVPEGQEYDSHVRALILYPMNALVNDQVARLCRFLKYLPEITFGKYINLDETPDSTRQFTGRINDWRNTFQGQLENLVVDAEENALLVDDASLANEYRYRREWEPCVPNGHIRRGSLAPRGPADILITNYSMLENLLLDPEKSFFFDKVWDFVVLDEAHSYTGATGTEMAWLMRRLKNRLCRNGNQNALQYIATSATLSDSADMEVKKTKAYQFAKNIFPIQATEQTTHVEFGSAAADDLNAADAPCAQNRRLFDYLNEPEVAALVKDTIVFEGEKSAAKSKAQRALMLSYALRSRGDQGNSCYVTAGQLASLGWCFSDDERKLHLEEMLPVVVVDDSIRCLVKLALCREREGADPNKVWADQLHDPLLHTAEKVGNRLEVRNEWGAIVEGNGRAEISFVTFRFLYNVLMDFARDQQSLSDICIERFKIQLNSDCRNLLQDKLNELKGEVLPVMGKMSVWQQKSLGGITQDDSNRAKINARWHDLLQDNSDSNYQELIYRKFAQHPDFQSYKECLFEANGNPKSPKRFLGIAQHMAMNGDQLLQVLKFGSLAIPRGRRKPLVDVRYHQVVRDITDVGVYFRNGDVNDPKFVRTDAEFSPTGEKIFTLGACRDCGQPYLMAYIRSEVDLTDGNVPNGLPVHMFRSQSDATAVTRLHAFTWKDPEGLEDEIPLDPESPRPRRNNLWVDLITGEICDRQPAEHPSHEVYWLCTPRDNDNPEFIEQCPRCGAKATHRTGIRYGNVMPYEASGRQFKIRLLDAFAALAEPDPDPLVQDSTTAAGRKVLAFSDSRSMASGLALNFEYFKNIRLKDFLLLFVRKNQEAIPYSAVVEYEQSLRIWEKEFNEGSATEEEFANECAHCLQTFKRRRSRFNDALATVCDFVGEDDGSYNQLLQGDWYYPQMMDLETVKRDDNGQEVPAYVNDKRKMTLYLMMQAIRDTSRNGLLKSGYITIRSRSIESLSHGILDRLGRSGNLQLTNDQVKAVLNRIYSYFVSSRALTFDDFGGELPKDIDGQRQKPLIRMAAFTGENYAVGKIVRKYFREQGIVDNVGNINIQGFLRLWRDAFQGSRRDEADVQHIFATQKPIGNNGANADVTFLVNGQDERGKPGLRVSFSFACQDAIISLTPAGETYVNNHRPIMNGRIDGATLPIMPFVIEEHTAQINSVLGGAYQQAFKEGRINILSCSTTFEMGIDVGGLNNVFLGNLPPEPANYRQRAGRAGRRPGAPAYILSLAGSRRPHDQNYYEDVGKLFFGAVTPPAIYLDRTVFAARHFRAEAFADFLKWLYDNTNVAGSWKSVSSFLLGYKYKRGAWIRNEHEYEDGLEKVIDDGIDICTRYLCEWKNNRGEAVSADLEHVEGYKDFVAGLRSQFPAFTYSAAEDLVFQLLPNITQQPYDVSLFLGSAHLPENNEESKNYRRMALKDHLKAKFFYLRKGKGGSHENGQGPNDAEAVYNPLDDQWLVELQFENNHQKIGDILQEQLLKMQTLDFLRSTCVLPKYGFPSDLISLEPAANDKYAHGVKLERSLAQGMFEYAPDQVVVANKRSYQVDRPVYVKWMGATAGRGTVDVQEQNGEQMVRFCAHCHRLVMREENGGRQNGNCPYCGSPLQLMKVVTPQAFVSKYSKKSDEYIIQGSRGVGVFQCTGSVRNREKVPGLGIETGESQDRILRIANLGPRAQGFELGNQRGYAFLDEIRTDIAIWVVSERVQFLEWNGDEKRIDRAFASAFYALKRAVCEKLTLSDRDITGQYMKMYQNGNIQRQFVFWDNASGGGGYTLALTHHGPGSTSSVDIKKLFEDARDKMLQCTCGGQQDLQQNNKPVPMSTYVTETENNRRTLRVCCSCYSCLKEFDNQNLHAELDRFDAAEVLDRILQCSDIVPPAEEPIEEPNSSDSGDNSVEDCSDVSDEGVKTVNGCAFRLLFPEERRNFRPGPYCLFGDGHIGWSNARNVADVIGVKED